MIIAMSCTKECFHYLIVDIIISIYNAYNYIVEIL